MRLNTHDVSCRSQNVIVVVGVGGDIVVVVAVVDNVWEFVTQPISMLATAAKSPWTKVQNWLFMIGAVAAQFKKNSHFRGNPNLPFHEVPLMWKIPNMFSANWGAVAGCTVYGQLLLLWNSETAPNRELALPARPFTRMKCQNTVERALWWWSKYHRVPSYLWMTDERWDCKQRWERECGWLY